MTKFEGDIAPSHGDYGGKCTLVLADGRFELARCTYAPYHIEDGENLRGTYTVAPDEMRLEATERITYREETVRQVQRQTGAWRLFLRAADADGASPSNPQATGPFDLFLETVRKKQRREMLLATLRKVTSDEVTG